MSLFVVCDNRNEEEEKRRRRMGKEGGDSIIPMSLFVVCDNRKEKRRRGMGKEGGDEKQVLKNGNQMEWGMEREMKREM